MINNDVLREFRYALDLSDSKLLAFFGAGGVTLPAARLMAMLKREDELGFEPLSDDLLGRCLDGFIEARRGPRGPDATQESAAPAAMNNNRILRALKIALELKDTDIVSIMQLTGFVASKGEVNALFRREGHPNFQACGDQFLRNFLRGLAIHHRGAAAD